MGKAATKEPGVLVVDDERLIRWTLAEALRGWGYAPSEAADASTALQLFESEKPAAVLLDINLPDRSGLEVLREIRRRDTHALVIMVTAAVLVENAVAALRAGAYDFVGKPVNLEELQVTVRNALEAGRMRKELSSIRGERARKFGFEQIVGESPPMREMTRLARKVAESEVSSVLLQGESGTGKDLLAKAIHYASRRAEEQFVAINCAAIPATLIESELFGYEKGAFTDAKARKEGLFEQAEGGTLFLDEIGELELGLQAKLLRVLEEGTFRRVGGLKDIPLDVRLIAASGGEADRVRANTSEEVNARLDRNMRVRVEGYATRSAAEITRRIEALDREWDMERLLETNASALAGVGVVLAAATGSRKWLILPGVVLSFLFQHAVQGWCPPVPVFRRLGVRTREEIDREKYALKALRGDFEVVSASHGAAGEQARAARALEATET